MTPTRSVGAPETRMGCASRGVRRARYGPRERLSGRRTLRRSTALVKAKTTTSCGVVEKGAQDGRARCGRAVEGVWRGGARLWTACGEAPVAVVSGGQCMTSERRSCGVVRRASAYSYERMTALPALFQGDSGDREQEALVHVSLLGLYGGPFAWEPAANGPLAVSSGIFSMRARGSRSSQSRENDARTPLSRHRLEPFRPSAGSRCLAKRRRAWSPWVRV
jgi:hypothetical protein